MFRLHGISDDEEFRLETTRNNERDVYSDTVSQKMRVCTELTLSTFMSWLKNRIHHQYDH